MYKVFFKESCFLLTDNQNLLKEGDIRWVHRDFMTTKNFIYQTLEKGIPFKAVLYDEDPEDLFTIFKSCFTYVKAGGGAVIQNSDILVIKRLGMIDLPKGIWRNDGTMCRPGSRRRMRVKTSKYSVSFRHHPPYLLPE